MIVAVYVAKDRDLYTCRMCLPGPFVVCGVCGTGLGSEPLLRVGLLCLCGARVVSMLVVDAADRPWDTMRPAPALVPSDTGITGAIPLPPDEWHPAFTDEGWAAQNRKINDLLMGRAG